MARKQVSFQYPWHYFLSAEIYSFWPVERQKKSLPLIFLQYFCNLDQNMDLFYHGLTLNVHFTALQTSSANDVSGIPRNKWYIFVQWDWTKFNVDIISRPRWRPPVGNKVVMLAPQQVMHDEYIVPSPWRICDGRSSLRVRRTGESRAERTKKSPSIVNQLSRAAPAGAGRGPGYCLVPPECHRTRTYKL